MKRFPSHIEISGRKIGPDEPCYVIAEGGVSHFGLLTKAFELINLAKISGADVYKTQHYRTNKLVGPSSPEWRDRLRAKEMPDEAICAMKEYCTNQGIPFLCTPHDEDVLEFLDVTLDVPAFKIGSGEVENWPFLANVARRNKPIILSTGMYELTQIEEAIKLLADNGCDQLAILHCVTSYPAAPSIINLKVMDQIRQFFDGPVGYSDHTEGTAIPLAAVAIGADIVEKHITLARDVPNAQDWKVSCGADTFPGFVRDVRLIEKALGGAPKTLSSAEIQSIQWARKSLTAKQSIPAGTKITACMLAVQRPGTGLSASLLDSVVGTVASCNISSGEIITASMIRRST